MGADPANLGRVTLEPDDLVQGAVARALRLRPPSELDERLAYLRRAILNLARNRRRGLARSRRTLARIAGFEQTTLLTVDLEAFGAATAPGISSPPETVHPPWLAPIAWVPFG